MYGVSRGGLRGRKASARDSTTMYNVSSGGLRQRKVSRPSRSFSAVNSVEGNSESILQALFGAVIVAATMITAGILGHIFLSLWLEPQLFVATSVFLAYLLTKHIVREWKSFTGETNGNDNVEALFGAVIAAAAMIIAAILGHIFLSLWLEPELILATSVFLAYYLLTKQIVREY